MRFQDVLKAFLSSFSVLIVNSSPMANGDAASASTAETASGGMENVEPLRFPQVQDLVALPGGVLWSASAFQSELIRATGGSVYCQQKSPPWEVNCTHLVIVIMSHAQSYRDRVVVLCLRRGGVRWAFLCRMVVKWLASCWVLCWSGRRRMIVKNAGKSAIAVFRRVGCFTIESQHASIYVYFRHVRMSHYWLMLCYKRNTYRRF